MDDFIYFSSDENFPISFRKQIGKRFDISDHSEMSWFLGVKGGFGENGSISLSQSQYIANLLDKFGMSDCKALGTPGPEKLVLSKTDCPEPDSEEAKAK